VQPNGLAFSVDEGVLYVIDSRRGQIRAFDVLPNGLLAKQTDRLFADLNGSEPGNPDGMKVDTAGNVYSGGTGGIWILDPQGKNSDGSSTDTRRQLTSALAAMIGRRSSSPGETLWVP
jgi:gluconolactonase